MNTAKIFTNGRSQAVRLPKDYRFSENEVYVHKIGDIVMLFPKKKSWETFLNGLYEFSDDIFEEGRVAEDPPEREYL